MVRGRRQRLKGLGTGVTDCVHQVSIAVQISLKSRNINSKLSSSMSHADCLNKFPDLVTARKIGGPVRRLAKSFGFDLKHKHMPVNYSSRAARREKVSGNLQWSLLLWQTRRRFQRESAMTRGHDGKKVNSHNTATHTSTEVPSVGACWLLLADILKCKWWLGVKCEVGGWRKIQIIPFHVSFCVCFASFLLYPCSIGSWRRTTCTGDRICH
ncbi:hypothetical protein DFJ43DRAFT_1061020 [Lentinula guzmanii]|uniref:Uncharacterized protein n=1 Tax=Lentinula guzmanii TaxID=2804957 RepID=A0AA38N247_9AGAR|nr:hypothetical protein DFJ43DRAFT_1061020 [Lentinula guzmanii]